MRRITALVGLLLTAVIYLYLLIYKDTPLPEDTFITLSPSTFNVTTAFTRVMTSIRQVGTKNTLEYRCFLQDKATGKVISPFHDIPLVHEGNVLNMVVEVPRFSNAKLEISKDEAMNPIKQDVKKGALRYVKNCFPYHGYLWNYGAFPQTWESPFVVDTHTGLKGDNDPIDVIEIGSRVAETGDVRQVKVLGALAMLDEGETDWKIIAIDVTDPMASALNDASDIEVNCPGLLDATRRWFTVYKIPDGKPANNFAFDGQVQDKAFAMRVIMETNEMWRELREGRVNDDHKIAVASVENLSLGEAKEDAPLPENVNGWSFIPAEFN